MAIVRTAGTEIIRSVHFEDVNNSPNNDLIVGVQHHIYTVLSIIVYFDAVGGSTDADKACVISLLGYDSYAGTTAQNMTIAKSQGRAAGDTFVWNDKFSFNGCEPADFTGPMGDATKQDAIADQDPSNGSPVAQKLQIWSGNASTTLDVHITYVDQNNA